MTKTPLRRLVLTGAGLTAIMTLALGGVAWAGGPNPGPGRPAGPPIARMGVYTRSLAFTNAFGHIITHPVTYQNAFLNTDGWRAIDSEGAIAWYKWEYPGYNLIWNVPMLPMVSYGDTRPVDGVSLAAEARRAYTGYFVTLAKELVAEGQGHAYLRLGWEPNGWWYPWSVHRCPGSWHWGEWSCYARAWQITVTAMRSVPGADFRFEWTPYAGTASAVSSWPGRAYVNVVGLDVFNWGKPWSHELGATTGLNWLQHTAQRVVLPETISEWGMTKGTAGSDGPAVSFIERMVRWMFYRNVVNSEYWAPGGVGNPNSAWALWHTLRGR